MKKHLITLLSAILVSSLAYSQNAVDALRYSQIFNGGTARYMSMGGAFGALGGDFSAVTSNPGGLGIYKSSEFSLTPSLHVGSTNSNYNGFTADDSRSNFAMANASYVYARQLSSRQNQKGFRYVQFAMGLNRLNDFNRRMLMTGPNPENSLLDTYVEYADGIFYRDIETNRGGLYGYDLYPAWWTYLLDAADTINNIYYSPIPYGGTIQRKIIEQKGSMNEWSFAIAGNFQDILYLGMSMNIPWIRYFENSIYSEIDEADTIFDFRQFNIYDRLETQGAGFNMKFGFIVRPADFIRIGGAFHTPTWYNMSDYWERETESLFDNGDYYNELSPYGAYDYKLTTPMRVQGSLAFIIGPYGLISGEYEYVDYSSAKLRASDYDFFAENNDINTSYGQGHNFRAGTEWRTGPFSFRAGYAFRNSPYLNDINDGATTSYSGGIGFKSMAYFIDLAYVYTTRTEDYYFYGTENIRVNPVQNKLRDHRLLLTFGARF